jgi:hypothetical protein
MADAFGGKRGSPRRNGGAAKAKTAGTGLIRKRSKRW